MEQATTIAAGVMPRPARRKDFLAAIMIMAMAAAGLGFITQTATFTAKLGAAFAFAILASVIIDFVVPLNIWRVVTITKMRASDWLLMAGVLVCLVTWYMAYKSIGPFFAFLSM